MSALPSMLFLDAWDGGAPVCGPPGDGVVRTIMDRPVPEAGRTLFPKRRDLSDWRDLDVGWGLVLPHNPDLHPADLAWAHDAPEPVRRLLAARQTEVGKHATIPVLRSYCPKVPKDADRRTSTAFLVNHRTGKPLHIRSKYGLGVDRIPRYLLLVGPPDPAGLSWSLQFALNATRCVGRLDLDDDGLENYVNALLSDWSNQPAQDDRVLVWSAFQKVGDPMGDLMRHAIGRKVVEKFSNDDDRSFRVKHAEGENATADALADALATEQPGLIVTTSHGQTETAGGPEILARGLGLPIDGLGREVTPERILERWQPGGAIWYSHACCGAGCFGGNRYEGVLTPDSRAARTLTSIGKLPPAVAPLPKALLAAKSPLRDSLRQSIRLST